jgi:hypothetical protein
MVVSQFTSVLREGRPRALSRYASGGVRQIGGPDQLRQSAVTPSRDPLAATPCERERRSRRPPNRTLAFTQGVGKRSSIIVQSRNCDGMRDPAAA